MDSWSSVQLYTAVVGVTTVVAMVLLEAGRPVEEAPETNAVHPMSALPVAPVPQKRREPQWYVFKWINVAVVTAFVAVVGHTCVQSPISTSPWQFMVAWSVLLVYCLGFFGVSLVHDSMRSTEEHLLSPPPPPLAQQSPPESVPATISIPNEPVPPLPASQFATHSTCASEGISGTYSDKARDGISKATTVAPPSSKDDTNDVVDAANLVIRNKLKDHELERVLDPLRAVQARRLVMQHKLAHLSKDTFPLDGLPWLHSLDYHRVHGANCESVVGYVPIPVGIVGPLVVNGESVLVPMATTEGCLVASTNRGAKAITQSGGAFAELVRDGITRAPCLRVPSARDAARVKLWCERPEHFVQLQAAFESTTAFGKLTACAPTIAGRNVYLRLVCFAGDAMGMNMVSKGSLAVIECLKRHFPQLELVALSGNMCADKKAAAINWIEGRGKSVVVEATIAQAVVQNTLKTTVSALVHTNLHKNLIGSAMAGMAAGGFNAHAANVVTAIFLATGQDPAQNVESSNCITLLEETPDGDLWISCTMPSLEVGTVGGGTALDAQAACLRAMACQGGNATSPGANAQRLAKIIAATTLAGELSLLAALAANTLVEAHLQHNRKT